MKFKILERAIEFEDARMPHRNPGEYLDTLITKYYYGFDEATVWKIFYNKFAWFSELWNKYSLKSARRDDPFRMVINIGYRGMSAKEYGYYYTIPIIPISCVALMIFGSPLLLGYCLSAIVIGLLCAVIWPIIECLCFRGEEEEKEQCCENSAQIEFAATAGLLTVEFFAWLIIVIIKIVIGPILGPIVLIVGCCIPDPFEDTTGQTSEV